MQCIDGNACFFKLIRNLQEFFEREPEIGLGGCLILVILAFSEDRFTFPITIILCPFMPDKRTLSSPAVIDERPR